MLFLRLSRTYSRIIMIENKLNRLFTIINKTMFHNYLIILYKLKINITYSIISNVSIYCLPSVYNTHYDFKKFENYSNIFINSATSLFLKINIM